MSNRLSKPVVIAVIMPLAALLLNGCSVFMAMHGKQDANLSTLSIGQDRSIVLLNLGQPEKTLATEGKRVDVFKLQRGNAPSGGRALGHGALDVLTLGLWEVAGTPIEAVQGETFYLTIEYDENDKVKKVVTGDTSSGGAM